MKLVPQKTTCRNHKLVQLMPNVNYLYANYIRTQIYLLLDLGRPRYKSSRQCFILEVVVGSSLMFGREHTSYSMSQWLLSCHSHSLFHTHTHAHTLTHPPFPYVRGTPIGTRPTWKLRRQHHLPVIVMNHQLLLLLLLLSGVHILMLSPLLFRDYSHSPLNKNVLALRHQLQWNSFITNKSLFPYLSLNI